MKTLLIGLFFCAYIAAAQDALPDLAKYVIPKDGHLYLDGERVRFWGVVGDFPGKSHADNTAVVKRLKRLGFNLVRFWREPKGDETYVKGDGSRNDLIDHFLWECQQNGIKIWYAALNNVGKAYPTDVDIVDDRATSAAWKETISEKGSHIRNNLARIWDPRLEALGIERMKAIANHRSLYTGLRYADDPNLAIWELSNEEWWFWKVKSRLASVPDFFLKQLSEDWNDYLHKTYVDEEAIRKAWLGLLPSESFEEKTIRLLPLRRSAVDWQGRVLGVDIQEGLKEAYGVEDFNHQRGADVIKFLTDKWIIHKGKEEAVLQSWGKSLQLGSLVWDTGIGDEIQSQWLHSQANAIAHCTYMNGFHHDPAYQRYPWYSGLEELPRMSWDQPWLSQNKIEGKPFFVYETQIHNPAKYRAEYPMRMASIASFQDWDVVVWHYFGPAPDANLDRPYDQAMDYTRGGRNHPYGLHFQYDEVQQSAMTAASHIFLQQSLRPAPDPTVFVFGQKDVYDPLTLENRGYFYDQMERFIATTFRYGSRMEIDTSRATGEVIGPSYKGRVAEVNPIAPTSEISYDWQRGHVMFDAERASVYSGFFSQYGSPVLTFEGSSLAVRNIEVINPANTPYPVEEDEGYVTLSCVSTDGQALEESDEVIISAVSTSFNTGFVLKPENLKREFAWTFKENEGATVSTGSTPVLVSRVGAVFSAPFLQGKSYEMLDFHFNVLKRGKIKGQELPLSADLPVFLIRIMKN